MISFRAPAPDSPAAIQSLFARWQRLEADRAALSEDLKELFAEANGNSLNPKALRKAFRIKAQEDKPTTDADKELQAAVDDYLAALEITAKTYRRLPPAPARVENPSVRPPQAAAQAPARAEPLASSAEKIASIPSDRPLKSPAAVATTHPVSVTEETAGTEGGSLPVRTIAPRDDDAQAEAGIAGGSRPAPEPDDYPVMPVFLRRTA